MVSHADCTHPNTKAGRAACRKIAAGGEAPKPRTPKPKESTPPQIVASVDPAPPAAEEEQPRKRGLLRRR
jgi:hypothetical protein